MRRLLFLFLIGLLFCFVLPGSAQPSFVEPYRLFVLNTKTTHVIFPSPIKSIDRGSPDILAQKSPGTDEILQLKADHARIAQTNITVVTTDNRLYSFLVLFDSMPQHLTISFDNSAGASSNMFPLHEPFNTSRTATGNLPEETSLKRMADAAQGKTSSWLGLKSTHGGIQVRLGAIFIRDDIYYFLFRVYNHSNISYLPGNISFTVRDTRRVKRVASQERPVNIIYQKGTGSSVSGPGESSWVIATSKFTLEEGKRLQIEILEANGGRNLSFDIKNRQLLSARKL